MMVRARSPKNAPTSHDQAARASRMSTARTRATIPASNSPSNLVIGIERRTSQTVTTANTPAWRRKPIEPYPFESLSDPHVKAEFRRERTFMPFGTKAFPERPATGATVHGPLPPLRFGHRDRSTEPGILLPHGRYKRYLG